MLVFLNILFALLIPMRTKVYINLEKVNSIITHTGITFENDNKNIRYDFRAFNNNDDYSTTEESRKNITLMFLNINSKFFDLKGFNEFRDDILEYSNDILIGTTNYSIEEIIDYEKTINKKYILGIYDCRHYVNNLCIWALNISIPIWNLDNLLK